MTTQIRSRAIPKTPSQAIREGLEACQDLWGETSFKGLIKRFVRQLQLRGMTAFGAASVSGDEKKQVFSPLQLKIPGVEALDLWEEVASYLMATKVASDEMRRGFTRITLGRETYCLAIVEDTTPAGRTLLIWQAPYVNETEELLVELLVGQLQQQCQWLRQLDHTQALIYRDDLTGLFNNRYFEVALDAELRRADRFQTTFCLLFLDLDDFKPINDVHGHLSGSGVLKQVAEILREAVREVDIPIRYGGDEFVIVLLGATSAKGLLVAERIRTLIAAKHFVLEDGSTGRLTASIGVAAYPEHGRDRETLLRKADETMYRSKRAGKNRVTVVGSQDAPSEDRLRPS